MADLRNGLLHDVLVLVLVDALLVEVRLEEVLNFLDDTLLAL